MTMKHSIHRVSSVTVTGTYTLRVSFADGSMQVINLEPALHGELYGPLRDPDLFRQARVDPEVHTVVWPNGADFDPATLHDWPERGPELIALTRQWEHQRAGKS